MQKVIGIGLLLLLFIGFGWQSAEAAEDEVVLPDGFAVPQEIEEAVVLKYAWYGRLSDFTDVYAEPSLGAEIVRNVGDGYLFATILREHQAEGNTWYQINSNEYVLAEQVEIANPTDFQGVEVVAQPERPFGWIVRGHVRPSSEPGAEPNPDYDRMFRYDFFQVFDAVKVPEGDDNWIWYQVGEDMWIKQTNVSLVDVTPAPHDVPDDAFWVEVDVYEQTLVAYEGSQMVYATLISSGLSQWPTFEGLYQVSDRFASVKMSGAEQQVDYYFIEDVPYTMYFNMRAEIALHGAYWHDNFGYKASHGCVNMPPRDSEWVFFWSENYEDDLWVYVHTSDPNLIFSPPVEELLELNASAPRRLLQ